MGPFSVPLVGGGGIVNKIAIGVKEISLVLPRLASTSCWDALGGAAPGPKSA